MGIALGGGAGGKRAQVQPSMNITPLVDVVLVLLIIFMVVTPLLSKQFWLHIPKKPEKVEPADPNADPPLVLTVDKSGTLKVNGQVFTEGELRERLPRLVAAKADRTVFFDATNDAPYAVAVSAMDVAKKSGAKTVAILTDPVAK